MKFIAYTFCLLLVLSLTSCVITENIYINEDGTGKYAFDLDASQLLAMAGQSENSTRSKKETLDSIISFKEIFEEKKDSIANLSPQEQARLKKMENFKIHIEMNEAEEKMKYSLFTEFKNISELDEMMSPLQSLTTFGGAQDKMPPGMSGAAAGNNALQQFFYDGKTFKKSLKAKPEEVVDEEMEVVYVNEVKTDNAVEEVEESDAEVEEDEFSKSLDESMEAMFAQSNFKIKYTFPKPVKKVNSKYEVMYSEDRKTITVEVPFKEYMENVEKSNIEVEFE